MAERETKTVELPLTKSEQRHLDNIRRRDAKRARSKAKQMSVQERDSKLIALRDEYLPKIIKLQDEWRSKHKEIWKDWKEERASS